MSSADSPKPPAQNAATGRAQRAKWTDSIEEQLADARDRGLFDNLPGTGRPLQIPSNLYAGDRELAYSLLHQAHVSPPEIERGKEIDDDLQRAESILADLRVKRDRLIAAHRAPAPSDVRAYHVVRTQASARYLEAMKRINSNILSLNIIAPAALHRRLLDIDDRMQKFEHEFPRLDGQ